MTVSRYTLGAIAALIPVAACTVGQGSRPPGHLVIIGGALQSENEAVFRSVISARSGAGPICVVPTASSDPEEAIAGMVATLDGYAGAGSAKGILISTEDPSRAQSDSVAAEIAMCSGFYFTGGSQSRILDVFLPDGDTTAAYRALWNRWREGAVVAGSSAGAAMMSRAMIAGGGSDEAVAYGVAASRDSDGVQIRNGMGFFEPALLDQHFLARGRIGRLLVSAVDEESPPIGIGIDENTALVVVGDSAIVVGASGVVVVDARSAGRIARHRASGLRLELAGPGDVIDLQTFTVRRDTTKTAVAEREGEIALPEDPFARWAFLRLLVDLSASPASQAELTMPDATLRVVEDEGFSATMWAPSGGIEEAPSGFSAGPFRIDLLPPGS
jgi:cyanophycinase